MVNYNFWFNNKSAQEIGINLQEPIRFSEAVPIREAVNVPGRNGTLYFETNTYENRRGTAKCFIIKNNVEQEFDKITAFLFGNLGYCKLQTDEDLEHYWYAKVLNGAEIAVRVKMLAPFNIEFTCQPQRFLVSGDETITLTQSRIITNPTAFTSLPIIKVNGDGNGLLNVAGTVITLNSIDGNIILDCETQNAYKGTQNLNNTIAAPEFPKLFAGNNEISWSGNIESIEIIPRWWTL